MKKKGHRNLRIKSKTIAPQPGIKPQSIDGIKSQLSIKMDSKIKKKDAMKNLPARMKVKINGAKNKHSEDSIFGRNGRSRKKNEKHDNFLNEEDGLN